MPLFSASDADALFHLRWGEPARRAPRPACRPKPPRPAAGLLLRFTDAEGDWWLLGKRTRRLGGTWSNIGGSLEPDETPLAGALREFYEELDVEVAAIAGGRVTAEVQCGDERVPYTLFVVDVPVCFDDADLSWEHDDLAWFPTLEVDDLAVRDRLHRGFARAWLTIKESL